MPQQLSIVKEEPLTIEREEPLVPEGSAAGRFASNVGEMLNPITIGEGLYQTVRHPIDTATGIASETMGHLRRARDAGGLNDTANELTAAIPLVGPLLEGMSQQAKSGDIAGALGKGVGLLIAPKFYGAALGGASRVAKTAANPSRIASSLERGAASRVVDVMAPKVGPNKTRFGGMAEDVAPQLAKDPVTKSFSREGLHEKVATKLGEAESALDEAADARLSARSFLTQPIIEDLLRKRRQLTAEAVDASKSAQKVTTRESPILAGSERLDLRSGSPATVIDKTAEAYGRDVVPAPNAARVSQIDQAIQEIKALGPRAQYEPLRRIRQAYDGPAKAIYSPSMTADFLKAQGGKLGAADVTGTLRDALAKMDPKTAEANAHYSFWRKANDVLEATAEVERTRPKVGRVIAARIAATVLGGSAAGPAGAAAGLLGGPIIESMLSSAPTTKLRTARVMTKLAEAIRKGDIGHVNSLTAQLTQLTGVNVP